MDKRWNDTFRCGKCGSDWPNTEGRQMANADKTDYVRICVPCYIEYMRPIQPAEVAHDQ